MLRQRIEQLKHEYTDQYVVVDGDRPELLRFRGMIGQVKTINMSGRALVQFDLDRQAGWYDIKLDYLKVVDKPEPKPPPAAKAAAKPAAKKAEPTAPAPKEPPLSPLELARQEKEKAEQKETPQAAEGVPAQPRPSDSHDAG